MSYFDDSVCSMDEESDFGFSEDEENIVVAHAKKKKAAVAVVKKAPSAAAAAKKKKAAPKKKPVLDQDAGDCIVLSATKANVNKKEKTVEEMYQKKTQLEHILLRPDTYIGAVERVTQNMFVLEDDKIIEKEITFTPGLYKIFDEIVVNAADNKQRDPDMDLLEITVDAKANLITVKNNGKGIPVVMHKEHDCYVPTLIFGQLLTGSNFDDDEKKTTGGRNGYGAKLANVFSTKFVIECVDSERGVKFHQVFRDNMTVTEDPIVDRLTKSEQKAGDYVQISFSPDLPRFKMDELDADAVGLLSKRAYDIAGTMANRSGKKLRVSLNGNKLPIKNFKDYLGKFEAVAAPVAYASDERWEVAVAASPDANMTQISFVNAISTAKGGGHVNYIVDQICTHLMKVLNKKKDGADLKKPQIANHLTVMVNCLIENPTFDSQTKDNLTSRPKSFGSKFSLSPEFLKKVEKSEIVDKILSYASFKQREALKRKGGKKTVKLTGISKLDDANFAGTAKSQGCTLVVTEGDSAKSLAMAGLSVVGRDHYGVFPLKGKPMNVRDTNLKKVGENEEIKNLVDILGLKFGQVYDESNIKTLRYGHLMIMADQDTDGSHIKGLIINFIHHFWPTLLDIPGFLQQFITPIVKVTKGKKSKTFFTLPEYEQWSESTGNNGNGWTIKYYKGLGTSTSAEAKEYFSNLDTHEIHFNKLSDDKIDPEQVGGLDENIAINSLPNTGDDLIRMVFKKDRVDDRKNWLLTQPTKDVFVDYNGATKLGMKYSDFINKEYILFSNYDNVRSIPHMMDGFKPSQRKVLFGCLKRKLIKNEIKVAQLTGYIAEHSAYHHGEMSLQGTITNMAQTFVGSNNVNLLTPAGQFGTRRMGGSDAASARYIFTKLEPVARAIFHPDDDELLNYQNDDGLTIEPEFYVPVIPMVLVNGSEGIGTGWSCKVCNYNPREIIANLRRRIAGEEFEPMDPHYQGFSGSIVRQNDHKYAVEGTIRRINEATISITELPLKKWTQDYKEFLETLMVGDPKKGIAPEILDFRENHTETAIDFTVFADKTKIDAWEKEKQGLIGHFKLSGSLSTSNMTLFDEEHRIVKFDSPEEIMTAFYDIRLDYYDKRKANLVKNLEAEKLMLSNKARFVEEVCKGDLVVSNRKRVVILGDLQHRGYDLINPKKADKAANDENEEDDAEDEPSTAELARGYEYLLSMKIWALSYEKVEKLRAQLEQKGQALDELQATAAEQIWLNDLDAVEDALDERDAAIAADENRERRAQKKNQKHQAKVSKKKGGLKKKKDDWDSNMEEDDSEDDNDIMLGSEDEGVAFAKKKSAAVKQMKTRAPVIIAPRRLPAPKKRVESAAPPKAKAIRSKAPPKAKAAKKAPASPASSDAGSEMDEVELSLSQRLHKTLMVSPLGKKKRDSHDSKKRPSPRLVDSDGGGDAEDDIFMAEDSKPKKTLKAKRPTKAAAQKPKAAAKKKKNMSFSDSDSLEDEFDFKGSDVEDEVAVVPAPSRAGRGRAAAKPTTYVFSSDSEESDEVFSD